MHLKNKVAVITGSNRGIGKEILKNFSKNGANIFACSRTLDKKFTSYLSELEEEFKNKFLQ